MVVTCPHCGRTEQQTKSGMNGRNQRYKCQHCQRRYTPRPLQRGYSDAARKRALDLLERGDSMREVGLILGVSPRTVANWLKRPPDDDQSAATETPTEDGPRRQRATSLDVANRANVSVATVFDYVNNKGRMSDSTREKIARAMADLHFSPNALVRALRKRRTNVVGVLAYGITGLAGEEPRALNPSLIQGIADGALERGLELLVYPGWPQMRERYTSATFLSGQINGLLWAGPTIHEPMIHDLAAAGLPVVSMLSTCVPDSVGYVACDNVAASRRLTEHLIGLGHRRIAFMAPQGISDFNDRFHGCRDALRSAGLAVDSDLQMLFEWTGDACRTIVLNWLDRPDRPTAIVAADDPLARQIIDICHASGLRVPQDIAVTGFNGLSGPNGEYANFTTARQPFRDIGRRAVEMLTKLVDGAVAEDCRTLFEAKLQVGWTTVAGQTLARPCWPAIDTER